MKPGQSINLKLSVKKKLHSKRFYECKFILPEGWTVTGDSMNFDVLSIPGADERNYTITAGEKVEGTNRAVLQITAIGRSEVALIPLIFLG